ncbi:ferredoxin [Agromyces seonyuensis]|uniref:Ferredoxin n=1 Tax=Agromyces seonyuensis TaxID=2662446 RepID=A0A6I4P2Z5_9MICO|nr:ferredoxin [Agromyces seonyuensis]MWB97564.1 ferredoxin [Agromyces seonyuensis]
MELTANRSTCIGSGQCVFTDPDAFDQDDDGIVLVLRPQPSAGDELARATEAVQICPSRSLVLSEQSA